MKMATLVDLITAIARSENIDLRKLTIRECKHGKLELSVLTPQTILKMMLVPGKGDRSGRVDMRAKSNGQKARALWVALKPMLRDLPFDKKTIVGLHGDMDGVMAFAVARLVSADQGKADIRDDLANQLNEMAFAKGHANRGIAVRTDIGIAICGSVRKRFDFALLVVSPNDAKRMLEALSALPDGAGMDAIESAWASVVSIFDRKDVAARIKEAYQTHGIEGAWKVVEKLP